MSALMDEEIKRWAARRKTALVLEIIRAKTGVAEASRAYDLPPSRRLRVGSRMVAGGMENALRGNPQDVREQHERQLKDLQERGMVRRCWSCAPEKNAVPAERGREVIEAILTSNQSFGPWGEVSSATGSSLPRSWTACCITP